MPEPVKAPQSAPARRSVFSMLARCRAAISVKHKAALVIAVILIVGLAVGYGASSISSSGMVTIIQENLSACNASLAAANAGLEAANADLSEAASSLEACDARAESLETEISECSSSLDEYKSDIQDCTDRRDAILSELSSCQDNLSDVSSTIEDVQESYDKISENYARSRCCQLKVLTGNDYTMYFVENNKAECCYSTGEGQEYACTTEYDGQDLEEIDCS